MSRNFNPINFPSLLSVVHNAVLHAPNGLTAHEIAPLAGYAGTSGYSTMMAELTQADRKCDMDRLLPLMSATSSDAPMHFLARQLNGVFIRTQEPAQGGGEFAKGLAASAKEFAEFMQEVAVSIEDGDIPAEQLSRMDKEGHDAIDAIMVILRLARTTHEKQYGSVK